MYERNVTFKGIRECRLSMATNAHHKWAEFTETVPHLCLIYGETGDYWVGRFVVINPNWWDVLFDKSTTKELSDSDKEKYHEILEGKFLKNLIFKHHPDTKRKPDDKDFFNHRLLTEDR